MLRLFREFNNIFMEDEPRAKLESNHLGKSITHQLMVNWSLTFNLGQESALVCHFNWLYLSVDITLSVFLCLAAI